MERRKAVAFLVIVASIDLRPAQWLYPSMTMRFYDNRHAKKYPVKEIYTKKPNGKVEELAPDDSECICVNRWEAKEMALNEFLAWRFKEIGMSIDGQMRKVQ